MSLAVPVRNARAAGDLVPDLEFLKTSGWVFQWEQKHPRHVLGTVNTHIYSVYIYIYFQCVCIYIFSIYIYSIYSFANMRFFENPFITFKK